MFGGNKKKSIDDRSELDKDANKAIDQNLMAGEPVLVVIPGTSDSAIIGTDRRLLVFKKGLSGGAWGGQKVASWDYRHIQGVQIETGRATGVVLVHVPGAKVEDISYWTSGKGSAQSSPNALAIVGDQFDRAHEGVVRLRHLLLTVGQPVAASSIAAPVVAPAPAVLPIQDTINDPSYFLRTLSELRTVGLLSDKEFESKKSQLMKMVKR